MKEYNFHMITKKPWFKAKTYGWGWSLPLTWQGWVVYIVFFGFMIFDFYRIDKTSHSASDTIMKYVVEIVVATIILVIICFLTGEKPKWRWGK